MATDVNPAKKATPEECKNLRNAVLVRFLCFGREIDQMTSMLPTSSRRKYSPPNTGTAVVESYSSNYYSPFTELCLRRGLANKNRATGTALFISNRCTVSQRTKQYTPFRGIDHKSKLRTLTELWEPKSPVSSQLIQQDRISERRLFHRIIEES